MANKISISVLSGNDKDKSFSLDFLSSLLVGRSHSADLRLSEPDVSGKHFLLLRSEGRCYVKVLSHNGLKIDGRNFGEGATTPIEVGSTIALGVSVVLKVDALPDELGGEVENVTAATTIGTAEASAEDFFGAEEPEQSVELEEIKSEPAASSARVTEEPADDDSATVVGDAPTRADFDDPMTDAGENETQEMKTRVGSMEEIYERKRQLDRASAKRRWRISAMIVGFMLLLGVIWYLTGSRLHITNAEGPFLPNGQPDIAFFDCYNAEGENDIAIEYPRDDRMTIEVDENTNSIKIASFLGIDRDVPFRIEFTRIKNVADLKYSLEASFEGAMARHTAEGYSFEMRRGVRPKCEFWEDVFGGFCEIKTQRGSRFIRIEYTHSRGRELWHGMMFYFRRGDMVYTLKKEIPEMFWKRGDYRVTNEPHLALCAPFLRNHWESPGEVGLLDDSISVEDLVIKVRSELQAERVAAWPLVMNYIDTLLVRSWASDPGVRKEAEEFHRQMLDRMDKFYNERLFAHRVALKNRSGRKQLSILNDCKSVFGTMDRDRRSTMINNPEVWACR